MCFVCEDTPAWGGGGAHSGINDPGRARRQVPSIQFVTCQLAIIMCRRVSNPSQHPQLPFSSLPTATPRT
jgi:hypothetical protein